MQKPIIFPFLVGEKHANFKHKIKAKDFFVGPTKKVS